MIRTESRTTIGEVHGESPEVSRTVLHKTVEDGLDYRKLCEPWVEFCRKSQTISNGSGASDFRILLQQGD